MQKYNGYVVRENKLFNNIKAVRLRWKVVRAHGILLVCLQKYYWVPFQ